MKIVIAGAREVGTHLAKLLSGDNMDVILIDDDPERISQLAFLNIMTLLGSPTSISTLRDAEVNKADLFIAVTPVESVNIHACLLATNMGARKTVARIDNYELQKEESSTFYRRIGVSSLIYPEFLGGKAIAAAIATPWARLSIEFCEGSLLLLAVKVREKAPIVGQKLMDLGREHSKQYHVAAIKRGEDLIIPSGADVVLAEDIVFFMTPPDQQNAVRLVCGKKERDIRRVVFMGGRRMGVQASYVLPKDLDIVFVEEDRQRCEQLLQLVKGCHVIQGNVGDMEVFSELHLTARDCFVALGDNSGNNVLSCLNAKKLGVGKTVAEIEDVGYITIADNLNIGSTVNKKLLTASSIYQMLLDADKTSAKVYSLVDAQVAELEAQTDSYITKDMIKNLRIDRDITLGGMVRDGVGYTIGGDTRIQPGDHVVLVCREEKMRQAEKLFLS